MNLGRIAQADIEMFQKKIAQAREEGFNAARREISKPTGELGFVHLRYVFNTYKDYEKTIKESNEPSAQTQVRKDSPIR